MRDNHEGMVEFLEAFESEGNYFVRVVVPADTPGIYQFGVERAGYSTAKRILQFRPFGSSPGIPYRYFFNFGHGENEDGHYISVRVEQGREGKSFNIKSQELFASNLVWFGQIKEKSAIQHLAV